jgi:hypothetical protein
MPDVHPVLSEYVSIPMYMRLTLGTESSEMTRYMGSKGILDLTEFGLTHTLQAGIDLAPNYYCYGCRAGYGIRTSKNGTKRGARSRDFSVNTYSTLATTAGILASSVVGSRNSTLGISLSGRRASNRPRPPWAQALSGMVLRKCLLGMYVLGCVLMGSICVRRT